MAPARDTTGVIAQLTGVGSRNAHRSKSLPQGPQYNDPDRSTISSFQPDQESTQQFDTAADERSWVDRSGENDVDETGSDSRSIEIGRGLKSGQQRNYRSAAFADDFSEEQVLDLGDDSLYDLTMTPPARHANVKRRPVTVSKQINSRRIASGKEDDVTKTSDIVPIRTRQKPAAGRRTLSDIHNKVNAISDSSFIQPDLESAKPRTSRFSAARAAGAPNKVPSVFTSGTGLHQRTQRVTRGNDVDDGSAVGDQTAQSFMLPNLPNIAELVSGLRQDGTPVFTRTTKPRSRFASAHVARDRGREHTTRPLVETVALPDEEKAIFTSLQLLKEKVATMEEEKSEDMKRAEEYETEISSLRAQLQMQRRLRRSDSGFVSDEDRNIGQGLGAERGQTKMALQTAQDRVQRVESKLAAAESSSRRIIQERDGLITQLGVAFYSNEELKEENIRLASEVEDLEMKHEALQHDLRDEQLVSKGLRQQVKQLEKQHSEDLRRWTAREAELKARYKQRSARQQSESGRDADGPQSRRNRREMGQETQSRILDRVEQEVRRARAQATSRVKPQSALDVQSGIKARSRSRSQARPSAQGQRHSLPAAGTFSTAARPWKDEVEGDLVAQAIEQAGNGHSTTHHDDGGEDITYISFLDPDELSALRRKLEAERRASKQSRAASAPAVDGGVPRSQSAPRKSSLRDINRIIGYPPGDRKETGIAGRNVRVQSPETADAISYSNAADGDDAGDISMLSTTSRRPQRSKSFEEMTSAFILPDITVQAPPPPNPRTTHDSHSQSAPPATASAAPVPTPVSQRDGEDVDATSATVRPAQDPRDALAGVLAQLEGEVARLKARLGEAEREYAAHDPAAGKRRRVALKADVDRLLAAVEKRSEWVYALYDVLEGQQSGSGLDVGGTLGRLGVRLGGDVGPRFAGEDGGSVGSVDVTEGMAF